MYLLTRIESQLSPLGILLCSASNPLWKLYLFDIQEHSRHCLSLPHCLFPSLLYIQGHPKASQAKALRTRLVSTGNIDLSSMHHKLTWVPPTAQFWGSSVLVRWQTRRTCRLVRESCPRRTCTPGLQVLNPAFFLASWHVLFFWGRRRRGMVLDQFIGSLWVDPLSCASYSGLDISDVHVRENTLVGEAFYFSF